MNNKLHTIKYVVFDLFSAATAWTLFFIYRKMIIEIDNYVNLHNIFDKNYLISIFVIPVFWLLSYYLMGYYRDIYRKSRLKELWQTFTLSLLGVLIIFFILILDDFINTYKDYYLSLLFLFSTHFFLTYIPRVIITSTTIKRLRNRNIGFSTLLVGSNGEALQTFNEFKNQKKSAGNKFVGFINIYDKSNVELEKLIPKLGKFEDLDIIIKKQQIEEVIVAIESSEHKEINRILTKLHRTNVIIKVIPSMFDIVTGIANISALYSSPLIKIPNHLMTAVQENIKRLFDVFVSLFAILILSPVYTITAIAVKFSSKGPIIYAQERVGKNGKPFKIFKFRSMYLDSEKLGPSLSSDNDSRITKVGKFMRKTRLDEIPQFFNVLFGSMSLVGPRPERQFYIDKIVEKAPYYLKLHKVKPGITSWGQVKFGYAENVDEMVERLKYDIIYLQNMSLYVDFKILIYTVRTVIQGTGK